MTNPHLIPELAPGEVLPDPYNPGESWTVVSRTHTGLNPRHRAYVIRWSVDGVETVASDGPDSALVHAYGLRETRRECDAADERSEPTTMTAGAARPASLQPSAKPRPVQSARALQPAPAPELTLAELYDRRDYVMTRVEIVAPSVRNDGTPSGYADAVRRILAENGRDGWTELDTVGVWRGRREPGTMFVVYLPAEHAAPFVADIAADLRSAMPDQEAIQAVIGETVTLREL